MNERVSHIHIAIAADMTALLEDAPLGWRFGESPRPDHVTIVTGGRLDEGFRHALTARVAGSERTDIVDARAALPRLLSDLRIGGSRRMPVNVDALAPRLREIRLPREVVEADYLLAAVDLGSDQRLRPDILLGLWAELASPILRIAARISGHREGLTAELALGKRVDYAIVLDRFTGDGPLMMLHGSDPIALEVVVLAFRQLRSELPLDTPGPWEDELVQRATELNLGATGPVDLKISATSTVPASLHNHTAIVRHIEAAAARAGIDRVEWERF